MLHNRLSQAYIAVFILLAIITLLFIYLNRYRITPIDPAPHANNSVSEDQTEAISLEPETIAQEPPIKAIVIEPEAAPAKTRAEFIQQTSNNAIFSDLIYKQAEPAIINAQGEVVLNSSNTQAVVISREQLGEGATAGLHLHYPGMSSELEPPIVYLMSIHQGQSAVQAVAEADALFISAEELPKVSGNYFLNVVHYNPLNVRRQRYLFSLTEHTPAI